MRLTNHPFPSPLGRGVRGEGMPPMLLDSFHASQAQADAERQRILEQLGLRVLRVSSRDVESDLPRVVRLIEGELDQPAVPLSLGERACPERSRRGLGERAHAGRQPSCVTRRFALSRAPLTLGRYDPPSGLHLTSRNRTCDDPRNMRAATQTPRRGEQHPDLPHDLRRLDGLKRPSCKTNCHFVSAADADR